jgi:hypothetical protein
VGIEGIFSEKIIMGRYSIGEKGRGPVNKSEVLVWSNLHPHRPEGFRAKEQRIKVRNNIKYL